MIAVVGQMSSNEAGNTTDAQPCIPEPHVQEAEVTNFMLLRFSFSLPWSDGIMVGFMFKKMDCKSLHTPHFHGSDSGLPSLVTYMRLCLLIPTG